jgi:hypothetical protein
LNFGTIGLDGTFLMGMDGVGKTLSELVVGFEVVEWIESGNFV